MKKVLVDSSVWIEYFKGGTAADPVSSLIDSNLLCVNDLILAELVPFLRRRKQEKIIELLYEIDNIPLEINWQEILSFQVRNLSRGINNVGIPDLIITQNVIQNNLQLFSLDRHFALMKKVFRFLVFNK